jgi:hypothetical protein
MPACVCVFAPSTGSPPIVSSIGCAARPSWSGHLVARCPGARVTPIERDSVSMHAARAALAPQLLVSWVLAPARSPS